ncbi:RCC1 domain-containing protein [Methyloterricola oryzae]|uniref:RCC1 domain-containing protein n=1 Tax=Methyloterricola oryzae TaxID=1495050 RepID=UPI001300D0F9|nr:hypothetical protein [Methyloterricola oryzae]
MATAAWAALMAASGTQASPWSQLECAGKTSFVLSSRGTLFGTGLRTDGQLGDGRGDFPFVQTTWKRVLNRVIDIATDGSTSILLRKNGSVWTTGSNELGQTGEGKADKKHKKRRTWKKVFRSASSVDAGGFDTYVLGRDGTLWVTGVSDLGDLVYPVSGSISMAYSITWKATLDQVTRFTSNGIGAIASRYDGSVWSITYAPTGLALNSWTPMPAIANVVSMSSDGNNYFLVSSDGTLYQMSDANSDGALNQLDSSSGKEPIEITPTASNVASVQSGVYGTYTIAFDGTLSLRKQVDNGFGGVTWAWVPVLNEVTSLCIGDSHALALESDGSLWGAGDNSFGQFGDPAIASTGSAENWTVIQK